MSDHASCMAGVDLSLVQCLSNLDLEKLQPKQTLESLFHLFDNGAKGYLDSREVNHIIDQMVHIATGLDWDTSDLRPILTKLLRQMSSHSDGRLSLEDWLRAGSSTMPLLALLGLDTSVRDDGRHEWRLRRFVRDEHCNACHKQLTGLNNQGLRCVLCHDMIHAKCVTRASATCIATCSKSNQLRQLQHHWTSGNCSGGRCAGCGRSVSGSSPSSLRCRWCRACLHADCAELWPGFGQCQLANRLVLPPSAVYPAVLDGQPTALTFRLAPPPGCEPVLVFVNPKSGGRQGSRVLRRLRYLLNPRQVYDLIADKGPQRGLSLFNQLDQFRILVCGGDGTAGWLLEAMDAFEWSGGRRPPVAVLPLGTGNDLARCLSWGGGYNGESLDKILQRVASGTVVQLDRWRIGFSTTRSSTGSESAEQSVTEGCQPPIGIVNNYFSIGVDATIARRWHLRRERHPERFNSRLRNKLQYVAVGASELLGASCKNLHQHLDIICDGQALDLAAGPPLEGVAVLNIATIYGGRSLWSDDGRDSQFARRDMGDGLLELVGLEGAVHAGLVAGGFPSTGRRLAQCSEIVIRTRRPFAMQIDGEPWLQPPCTVSISRAGQAAMLAAPRTERTGGLRGLLCRP